MTEQTASKVPQIRFKGFDGEWEEKTLGDLGSFKNGMNFGKEAMGHGNPFVNLQNVFGQVDVDDKKLELAESSSVQRREYSLLKGDVLFIRSSVKPEGVGETALITKTLLDTTYSGFIIRFRPEARMSHDFNRIAYRTTAVRKQILANASRSANTNINQTALKKIALKVSSFEEQAQIGEYFRELDSLIGLHQRKHDKLVTLKKAMLQKMFPQPGATTPEIRFKGFSGDWEEKRLDEICEIIGGGTPSTSIQGYWGGDIDWYSPTEIGNDVYANGSIKKITLLGLSKSSAKLLPPGKTVMFTSRAGIGDMAILAKEGCTNQGFQSMVLNDDTDPYFIFSMGHLIKIHALKHASGSTFLEVSSKQLGKMKILLPKENEQQKIGTYFRQLDALISKHATQLQKLQQIKSASLEKMFV